MTGSGIAVDGWWITVCGGRDVAGASTGGMAITFENGVTYSDLGDQPGVFDGAGCFSYDAYLEVHPITFVTVSGIGDWSGSNWWVEDAPLPPPPPEPVPEPVAPPIPPAPVADSPVETGNDAPLTKVADGVVAPDFTATPFPTPTATPTTGSTFTLVPTSTPTPEPLSGEAFALDPLTATLGIMALGAAGGAAYLAIKTGVRR